MHFRSQDTFLLIQKRVDWFLMLIIKYFKWKRLKNSENISIIIFKSKKNQLKINF